MEVVTVLQIREELAIYLTLPRRLWRYQTDLEVVGFA